MASEIQNPDRLEQEALKFLDRDFNQCFNQMRHYDGQLFEICKFAFLADTTLVGVAVGLYQFQTKEHLHLEAALSAAFAVATIFGLFLFCLAVRNRVYFVQVARYINEQRGFFLAAKPLGFSNKARMYQDYHQPPFFNWRSSQAWLMYILAAINTFLAGVTFFNMTDSNQFPAWIIMAGVFIFVIQLGGGIYYLGSREQRSAESAVFGKGEILKP